MKATLNLQHYKYIVLNNTIQLTSIRASINYAIFNQLTYLFSNITTFYCINCSFWVKAILKNSFFLPKAEIVESRNPEDGQFKVLVDSHKQGMTLDDHSKEKECCFGFFTK